MDGFLAGDTEQARQGMLHLLYRSPQEIIGDALPSTDFRAMRPRALGEMLAGWAEEERNRETLAGGIADLGAIQDATSQRVARQYEENPYPRWTSIQLPREGSAADGLKAFFPPNRIAFLKAPLKVLIAGCGTGQQALAAAMRYGPEADVLAVDLSKTSLAYAKARADHYGIGNLRFARADILALGDREGPFQIIEAVGVLHHMAEPFKGWQALLERLSPGGLMSVGLYSAIAREGISKLRSEADYPGPACASHTARLYRQRLMGRSDDAARGLVHSYDFYTLSEFRDLVLHEHERPILLSEIEAFLAANGLTFRGFQLPPPVTQSFLAETPGERLPGSLQSWAKYEERRPRSFDAMYRFWCEKAV
jgi:SAM-dependent methyltransferase